MTYTHKGWFGFVPVLIGDINVDGVELLPRWGVPDFMIDVQASIFDFIAWTMGGDDWEYPIRITGRVE
jgi:hypothetical protein